MKRYMYKVNKKNLDSTISAVEAKILKILGFQNEGKRVAPMGKEHSTSGARASHHSTCGGKSVAKNSDI